MTTTSEVLRIGAALESIGQILIEDPSLEIRYSNGRITIWKDGVEEPYIAGTRGQVPGDFEWEWIQERLAE